MAVLHLFSSSFHKHSLSRLLQISNMEAHYREGLQACDSSEEGRCSDGGGSGEKGCGSGERDVEGEWSGLQHLGNLTRM